jgi:uncharacterized protein (DUF58 family)
MSGAVPPSTPPATVAAKAAALRRLELDVTRRLDGLLSGDYLALATGPGTERAGARPYEPGDDARRMDWNLTARSIVAYVRTTDADREMETWVIADRSASLDFGTADHEKREVVLAAAAAFGFLTARHGNRFGVLIAGGDRLTRMPARTGRASLLAAISRLYDSPRTEQQPGPGADLGAAIDTLGRVKNQRGQVVIVSDFLDTSDWAAAIRRLALRHQVIATHVTDPRELSLPAVGILGVIDPETGRRLHVQTNSPSLRQRYEEAAMARHQQIRSALLQAGAEHLHLSTDRDWLVDLARFVTARSAHRAARVRKAASLV